MRIRSAPVVDRLDRDGERLVLLPERAVRLVGLAPAILDLAAAGCDLDGLVESLEARFGAPPSGDSHDLVRQAVEDLAAEGLLVIEPAEGE